MKENIDRANRFGEKNISVPSHPSSPLIFEDEYGMTREEDVEFLDWSHDPRSESSHEIHSRKQSVVSVSDEVIYQHARLALNLSPELGIHSIEVKVLNGRIFLDGFVYSRKCKKAAENCVETLSGVVDVCNRLNILFY